MYLVFLAVATFFFFQIANGEESKYTSSQAIYYPLSETTGIVLGGNQEFWNNDWLSAYPGDNLECRGNSVYYSVEKLGKLKSELKLPNGRILKPNDPYMMVGFDGAISRNCEKWPSSGSSFELSLRSFIMSGGAGKLKEEMIIKTDKWPSQYEDTTIGVRKLGYETSTGSFKTIITFVVYSRLTPRDQLLSPVEYKNIHFQDIRDGKNIDLANEQTVYSRQVKVEYRNTISDNGSGLPKRIYFLQSLYRDGQYGVTDGVYWSKGDFVIKAIPNFEAAYNRVFQEPLPIRESKGRFICEFRKGQVCAGTPNCPLTYSRQRIANLDKDGNFTISKTEGWPPKVTVFVKDLNKGKPIAFLKIGDAEPFAVEPYRRIFFDYTSSGTTWDGIRCAWSTYWDGDLSFRQFNFNSDLIL